MSDDYYILDPSGVPKKAKNVIEWARWFEAKKEARRVQVTKILGAEVSTVFLGVDHSFGVGPPLLWETMVFGGKNDEDQDRCGGNIQDARLMHERMVKKVEAMEAAQ